MTQTIQVQSPNNEIESSCGTPLVVDLDGTLLRTDLTLETALRLIKQKPWLAAWIPFWLLRGRAYLKRRIFRLVQIDASLLPLHEDLLPWLQLEKSRGRRLVLATGSDHDQARAVVQPLALFDTVLGSDGQRNLKGRRKLKAIVEECGAQFDYVGNSRSDLPIWMNCRHSVLVNASGRLQRAARRAANVVRVFPQSGIHFRDVLRAMRCYQWVKNLLVFVPVLTSHTIFDWPVAGKASLAFFSFSFCASAAYIVNDLLDLDEDRLHDTKKNRPFASGRISIGTGIFIASVCLALSAAIGAWVSRGFLVALASYGAFTTLYSLSLKRLLVVDVLTLALLYTLRVVAGNLATGIVFSVWLLSFAFFLFLSLAFAKRAADLVQRRSGREKIVPGRGYVETDLEAVSMAGISSGFLSALVLALYTNSDAVQLLYHRPAFLWGLQPILLHYIIRLWVICRRGELTEDPIQYTVRDPSTYGAAVLALLALLAATFDFSFIGS